MRTMSGICNMPRPKLGKRGVLCEALKSPYFKQKLTGFMICEGETFTWISREQFLELHDSPNAAHEPRRGE